MAVCCLGSAPGCTVCRNALRTVVCEPARYCPNLDRVRSRRAYYEWAEQEWRVAASSCASDVAYSEDYAAGFAYGFVDYVTLGGTGEPPPVPPRTYWKTASRTGAGKERAAAWFEGYRHGAHVAREGGYRELATLQSSLVANMFDGQPADPAMGADMYPASPDGSPEFEDLPLPGDASPFQDDAPAKGGESGPAMETTAPASPPNDTDDANDWRAPRAAFHPPNALDSRDLLRIEDITPRAREKVRGALPHTPEASGAPAPNPVIKIQGTTIHDESGLAASPPIKTPVIRIVSAESNVASDAAAPPSCISK